jgi:ornithine--oxo-acid transaminase
MLYEGVVAKPTQKNVIRFSPPLVMTEAQLNEASSLIEKAWKKTN